MPDETLTSPNPVPTGGQTPTPSSTQPVQSQQSEANNGNQQSVAPQETQKEAQAPTPQGPSIDEHVKSDNEPASSDKPSGDSSTEHNAPKHPASDKEAHHTRKPHKPFSPEEANAMQKAIFMDEYAYLTRMKRDPLLKDKFTPEQQARLDFVQAEIIRLRREKPAAPAEHDQTKHTHPKHPKESDGTEAANISHDAHEKHEPHAVHKPQTEERAKEHDSGSTPPADTTVLSSSAEPTPQAQTESKSPTPAVSDPKGTDLDRLYEVQTRQAELQEELLKPETSDERKTTINEELQALHAEQLALQAEVTDTKEKKTPETPTVPAPPVEASAAQPQPAPPPAEGPAAPTPEQPQPEAAATPNIPDEQQSYLAPNTPPTQPAPAKQGGFGGFLRGLFGTTNNAVQTDPSAAPENQSTPSAEGLAAPDQDKQGNQ